MTSRPSSAWSVARAVAGSPGKSRSQATPSTGAPASAPIAAAASAITDAAKPRWSTIVAMNKPDLPPLTLIAGPTASGKSALTLELARDRPSVVVNADAMQVYRDLRVLTARPSTDEEAVVPHLLFGHIDGEVACSAADWAAQAKAALHDAWTTGMHPILVGGT